MAMEETSSTSSESSDAGKYAIKPENFEANLKSIKETIDSDKETLRALKESTSRSNWGDRADSANMSDQIKPLETKIAQGEKIYEGLFEELQKHNAQNTQKGPKR